MRNNVPLGSCYTPEKYNDLKICRDQNPWPKFRTLKLLLEKILEEYVCSNISWFLLDLSKTVVNIFGHRQHRCKCVWIKSFQPDITNNQIICNCLICSVQFILIELLLLFVVEFRNEIQLFIHFAHTLKTAVNPTSC